MHTPTSAFKSYESAGIITSTALVSSTSVTSGWLPAPDEVDELPPSLSDGGGVDKMRPPLSDGDPCGSAAFIFPLRGFTDAFDGCAYLCSVCFVSGLWVVVNEGVCFCVYCIFVVPCRCMVLV